MPALRQCATDVLVLRGSPALGDAVNLASRLDGLTKQYGVLLIIGEDARRAVSEMICRELEVREEKSAFRSRCREAARTARSHGACSRRCWRTVASSLPDFPAPARG